MEEGSKPRHLEDRMFLFAESVRSFVKQLPRTISNTEDVRQLVRASARLRLVDLGLNKNNLANREALAIEARELTLIFFIDYLEEWMTAPFLNLGIRHLFGIWELRFGTSRRVT